VPHKIAVQKTHRLPKQNPGHSGHKRHILLIDPKFFGGYRERDRNLGLQIHERGITFGPAMIQKA
jgi:hypothetical protein